MLRLRPRTDGITQKEQFALQPSWTFTIARVRPPEPTCEAGFSSRSRKMSLQKISAWPWVVSSANCGTRALCELPTT